MTGFNQPGHRKTRIFGTRGELSGDGVVIDINDFLTDETRRIDTCLTGDDPDRVSIGWEQHEYALKVLSGEIVDPTWYVVIFNYEGDDIYNEQNWADANPSLGHTIQIESLQEAAARAKQNPAEERLFRTVRSALPGPAEAIQGRLEHSGGHLCGARLRRISRRPSLAPVDRPWWTI